MGGRIRMSLPILVAACLLSAGARAAAPPRGAVARKDALGDPLPDGALARLGTSRLRLGHWVHALAYSPDGRLLASAGDYEKSIRVWDANTGELLRTFWGHRGRVVAVAFAPDGKRVVSGAEDATARVWDLTTGRELARFTGHAQVVRRVAFAAKGKAVVSSGDGHTVCRWDPATGQQLASFAVSGPPELAPRGDLLVSVRFHRGTGKSAVTVWDVLRGKSLGELPGVAGPVGGVALTPDGQAVAVRLFSGQVFVWDTASKRQISTFGDTGDGTGVMAFSPDGKTLSLADKRGVLRLWDVKSGKKKRALTGFAGLVLAQAFSPDGRRLASASGEMTVRLWDVESGKEVRHGAGSGGYVGALAFSADGKRLLVGGYDATVRLYDCATGKMVKGFAWAEQEAAMAVAFSPDGKLAAAGGEGGVVRLWDVDKGRLRYTLEPPAPRGRVRSLLFSGDGQTLFAAGAEVWGWSTRTGKLRLALPVRQPGPVALLTLPGGKTIFSVSDGGTGQSWHVARGKELCYVEGLGTSVVGAALSPDGKTVAVLGSYHPTGEEPAVRLVRLAGGGEVVGVWGKEHGHGLNHGIAYSPDGKYVAVASGRWVRLWEAATGRELPSLVGHRGGVHGVAFSPDGKYLASAGADTTVLLWDVDRLLRRRVAQRASLEPAEWELRWNELGDADARVVREAAPLLTAAGEQTATRVRAKLFPPRPDPKRLAKLLADLTDSRAKTQVRLKAGEELLKLGRVVKPDVQRLLKKRLDPDVQAEVEALVDKLDPSDWAEEARRAAEAAPVLARIGGQDARRLLLDLAKGDPKSPWTKQAKAALKGPPKPG